MSDTKLYEIVFSAPGYGREGFSVKLTPAQAKELEGRFERGMASGSVRDWRLFDLTEGGVSYEKLSAILERGDFVKGNFPPPDLSKDVYLVIATFKPKFFGLKKKRQVSVNVWMTPDQAKYIESILEQDGRLSDWQVVDQNENISTAEFLELLHERGV